MSTLAHVLAEAMPTLTYTPLLMNISYLFYCQVLSLVMNSHEQSRMRQDVSVCGPTEAKFGEAPSPKSK